METKTPNPLNSGPAPIDKETVAAKLAATQEVLAAAKPAVPKPLTPEQIKKLAETEPMLALQQLQFLKEFKTFQQEADERKANAALSAQVLVALNEEERNKHAQQDACERQSHMRADGRTCAVGGQKVGDGAKNMWICVRCFRTYIGIGNGPGQLPPHIAALIDPDTLGG